MNSRERAKMAAITSTCSQATPPSAGVNTCATTPANQQQVQVVGEGGSTQHATAASVQLLTCAAKTRRRLDRKRRTNRMLIAMVLIFVVCWLPLNVVHVTFETMEAELDEATPRDAAIYKFDHPQLVPGSSVISNVSTTTRRYSRMSRDYVYQRQLQQQQQSGTYLTVFFIVHLIAMSSAVYNPFLYAWLNENFKGHFARVVPWIFRYSTSPCCTCHVSRCLGYGRRARPSR